MRFLTKRRGPLLTRSSRFTVGNIAGKDQQSTGFSTADTTLRFQSGDCRHHCRPSVQAAAEKTSMFAAITGTAPIKKPYTTQSVAPPICTARNGPGREKK